MSKVAKLTITGSTNPLTLKEWMTSQRTAENVDLNEVFTNGLFTINDRGEYRTYGYNNKNEFEVDQTIAAQIISARLMHFIQKNPQNVTVEMLNNTEVVLTQYEVDFQTIRYLYEDKINGIVEKVLDKPGYKLPRSTNQLEFNRILACKIGEYVRDSGRTFDKTNAENLLEFVWQLDDVSACTAIRSSCDTRGDGYASKKSMRDSLLTTSKWFEWCKIFSNLIFNDDTPFRATQRFTGQKENSKSMASFLQKRYDESTSRIN